VLALFGAVGTRAAAEAFMACVREGWPRVYPRVFTEARNLAPHADVLFPELVELAGDNLGGVTDVLIEGLAARQIDPRRVELEPIAPLVARSLRAVLRRVAKHQRKTGTDWRFAEAYFEPRRDAGAWLELAGRVRAKSLDALLEQGLALADPRLALCAAVSIVRRGGTVTAEVLERIAACHETRALLFDKLAELDRLDLFPAAWRTWDAFAMGHMVEWLLYPSELGREPAAIEQMAVSEHGALAMYIYRFRDGRAWLAGVAGPFQRRGRPRPQHGSMTFSQFAKWNRATPEQHLRAVTKTLRAWAKARA
jgi:hypothetical protein